MLFQTYLLLGSNQGDSFALLAQARTLLHHKVGEIQQISAVYRTQAWGKTNQPDFYNQVVKLFTPFSPSALLQGVLAIERQMGRIRTEKWAARLIDIDILYFGEDIVSVSNLEIPHPQIPHRRFTLAPLAEIAPDFIHPVLLLSQQTLLAQCTDPLAVEVVVRP